MKSFKFFEGVNPLSGDDDYEFFTNADDFLPSWSWVEDTFYSIDDRYILTTEQHRGIWGFLSQFEPNTIVPVYSIMGPNGILHTAETENDGWGFHIQRDLLTITYYKQRNMLGEEQR
jgi:hypothetical protein